MGLIDSYFLRDDEFPGGVDFLMMGTPVETIVPLTKAFLPRLEAGCIISDVGSVKREIVHGMERMLPRQIPFIAGHPIAGSEQWGAQAARPNLFVRHRCVLTPTRKTDRKALKKIAALWRQVGAEVEIMSPELHDRLLGVISHLPHVLVYALVNALERAPLPGVDLKKYCAGGFKDFTRIASSPPGVVARYLPDESPSTRAIAGGLHPISDPAQWLDSRRQRHAAGKRVHAGLRGRQSIPD
jgi:prephenate dehydrogenase